MCKLFLLSFCFIVTGFSVAQELKGVVVNAVSNHPVSFAKIEIIELKKRTTSDINGAFSFHSLPKTRLHLQVRLMGFKPYNKEVNLGSNMELKIKLIPIHNVFDQIDIKAEGRKIERENIASLAIATKKQLFQTGAPTLGEALVQLPGVQAVSQGVGISKPVIRGLSGMRVVTYLNGLRIANQQWGQDHGSAASKLGIGNVSVIKGPASLLYGSDAIGGVIHFMDEDYVNEGEMEAYVSTKFITNSLGTSNEIGFKTGKNNWKLNVFANYLNHADYQIPGGKSVENTRFWGSNFKMAFGYHKKNYLLNIRYQLSYNKIGIPGETEVTYPTVEDFLLQKKQRKIIFPHQQIVNNFLLIDNIWFFKNSHLNVSIGNTNNDLQELAANNSPAEMHLNLNNTTYNVRYIYHISNQLHVKTGWQGMVKINRNVFPAEAMIIPNANIFDNGLYALLDARLGNWHLQAGARYDTRFMSVLSTENIDTSAVEIGVYKKGYHTFFQGFNFSGGITKKGKHTTFRLNVSSGYRAPSLTEMFVNGIHEGTLRFEKGNLELIPEKALQLDVALAIHYDHFEININPYFNRIKDYIALQKIGQKIDGYSVFAYNQTEMVYFYGFEVGFHFHPHHIHRLHISSSFSATFAETLYGDYINLIPQPDVVSSLRFDINNKGFIVFENVVLEHIYYLPQKRVGKFEVPSPDYSLFNLATHFTIGNAKAFDFSVGVRNIFNVRYSNHLSVLKELGIPNPGINGFIAIKYIFHKS